MKRFTIKNPPWINNDVNQTIARRQRTNYARKRNNTDETSAEFFTQRLLVKRALKPDTTRRSMLQDYAKLTLKASYSFINERIIVRDNVDLLKTPTG